MKRLVLICLAISSFFHIQAQHTISGKIVDEKSKPIFYVTAALLNAADSTIITGVTTDENGYFEFTDIANGEYLIMGNLLGYDEGYSDIFSAPASNITVTLREEVALLETVEITEKVPLLEQRADKLVVNVEGNITNSSSSLLDVMKKVPGMIVINDRITLAGSGTPTILLNGKSTQYVDIQSLLKDMPGDNIKKVEIIHQPGAEYEASGSGPILNIILKKNSLYGTNGSIFFSTGKGTLWDRSTGINISHFAGKFNISGGLGYSRNARLETLEIVRRLRGIGDNIDGDYIQTNISPEEPNSYRGNVRVEYDVSQQHRIGLEGKYITSQSTYNSPNITNIVPKNGNAYKLITDNAIDHSWMYTSINPYYVFEIDTSGRKLEIDFNAASYTVDEMNQLDTREEGVPGLISQRYNQPGDTKIYATKIDYTHPLSKQVEVKIGAKYSFADLDNDLQSTYLDEGQWKNNPNQSNHYLFSEKVYAGYGKLQWTADKWSGTLGLRYEKSESEGRSITIDSMQNRTISKLFPSASISRKISNKLTATAAYSYRINRPRYNSLNPFVYYIDPFTSDRGNPSLRPELTHSGKFTLSFDGQPFFNIEYKKSTDAIVEVTEQETNSQEAFKTDLNFDDRNSFSASLFFPLSFVRNLGGYGGVILAHTDFTSQYQGSTFDRKQWTTTAFLNMEYKLPWDIRAELGGWYQTAAQEGIFSAEHLWGSSAGISRKFMDNKLQVSMGIEDFIFRYWHAKVDYQQDVDIISKWQTPVWNVRLTYRFGNQFLKDKKRRTGSASEEIRRATQ